MPKLKTSQRESVSFAENKIQSLAKEIASRSRAYDFYSMGMYLPDPDPVLKAQGKDLKIYRELMSDSHVWACMQSRKSGVLSLEWEIDRGKAKSRQAKIVQQFFESIDTYQLISEILDAVFWGFQPLEVMWKKTGDLILPQSVFAKPAEWFVFDDENNLKFRTKSNWNGEDVPDRKFLCPQYNASYNNPYGERVLSRVFWPVTFKRGGLKFWLIFTEKYGMPFLLGRHPRGAKQEEIDDLADKLELMIQDAIAVIPDDDSVELKDFAGRASSAAIYKELVEMSNSEISKATLGQTLTTEIGDTGSYAASQTHFGVRQDIIDGDKKMVEKTINQLIRWIYDINFSSGNIPHFVMWHEEDVDKNLAERDKILTEAGIKFSKNYFVREYGFQEDDIEIAEITPSVPLSKGDDLIFAETSDQIAVDESIDNLDDNKLQNYIEVVLKPVIKLIQKSSDYNEVIEKLYELYPKLANKQIETMLQRAIFVAETWGRLNAQ